MTQLISELNKLKISLEALDDSEPVNNAKAMCDHLAWSIEETDTSLLVPQLVEALRSPINSAFNNRSNPNSVTANLLNAIKVLPLPLNRKRKRAESSRLIDDMKSEILATTQELDEEKGAFESSLAAQSSQLMILEGELKKAKSVIDSQASRLDALVDQAQTTFNEKRSEIVKENDVQLSELRTSLDKERGLQKEKYEGHLEDLLDLVSDKKVEADDKIKDLDKLLGLAGKKSLIADYSKISDSEGFASMVWSIFAIIILGSGVGIGVYILVIYGSPSEMTIPGLISRVILPFSVFVPGFYCAAKARGHREVQIRARNTGVRLTTLEPFLTKFSAETQNDIRATLVEEFFKSKEIKKEISSLFGIHPKNIIEYAKELKNVG